MRLFAALVPPAGVLADAIDALAVIKDARPDLRWAPAERMHLTLAFYGEVSDDTAQRLRSRLPKAVDRHRAMTLALAGAGAFPRRSRAQVLWLGVTGDRAQLVRLAGSVGAAGRRVGLDVTAGRSRPHLTVARAKRPCDVSAEVARLWDYHGETWQATEVALVASQLGPRPQYQTVESWPLTGG